MPNAISPELLSGVLGQKHRPTKQQSAIIGADPGPLLVVAGAGAGKTETMAARVVWLIANQIVTPDQILGLTFTRKAAQELSARIRGRLQTLAETPKVRDLDPSGTLADDLVNLTPTVATYDAYAAQLVREYGLLVPVEPASRMITAAELHGIAYQVVKDYRGQHSATGQAGTVTERLLKLITDMGNSLATPEEVIDESLAFIKELESLPPYGKKPDDYFTKDQQKWIKAQRERIDQFPLVRQLQEELASLGVTTFNEQMSVAARLASTHLSVGESQRRRFKVVMLDEYQDTSHSQRVLLTSLFGGQTDVTVTAVGDPMQAIYGWRGATSENLKEFVNDFPLDPITGQPAPKRQLTTSWRNPAEVLRLANHVSNELLGVGPDRPVEELTPRDGAPKGRVALGYFATAEDEVNAVADLLQEQYLHTQGEKFTAAVLVRKNKHTAAIARALENRGVPYEIFGLGGLLSLPEIADLVAIATMLIRPQNTPAALRILAGPSVGLGLADLVALRDRARNLTAGADKDQRRPHLGEDLPPEDRLRAQVDAILADPPEQIAGLTDAVADLGERSRYSAEGVRCLEALSSRLRTLRKYSLPKSLPDLFSDIIDVFGIRTEVLARPNSVGSVHLDAFLDSVASYPGDSLAGLLDYFELAREHEDGLAPGDAVVKEDRVQIMTVHKAKGLEWHTVSVLHADKNTYRGNTETFLTQSARIPDAEVDTTEAENRSQFSKIYEEYREEKKSELAEENARLFYVALTRAEENLIVTASPNGQRPGPYEHLEGLKGLKGPEGLAHGIEVLAWEVGDADVDKQEPEPAETGTFPYMHAEANAIAGAELVRAAMAAPPAVTPGETFDFWEQETTALIEEQEALRAPTVDVELPGELTASDLVALRADAQQFAKRQRRPVPFKPNSFAKRGTAFHQWLEDRFGATALLDEDQLPGIDEDTLDPAELDDLKAAFDRSEWAERTPEQVEQPFEVSIGDTVVRGRMDAVFRDPDDPTGWMIVDWKTGRKPTGEDRQAAVIQLAVYREAWARIIGTAEPIRAAFHYVATGETFEPRDLPDRARLEALLDSSTGGND
ncbi:ATP-dependent DNA helicase PcrA [Corynebacterium atrinae]|uniref:ATP-dependent helicase n=1 Tax=Corynebacterium atrinae TaxID=1336740 RepID=UPI0025B46B05|nr:UvrD-helicase domain-containing protein [Corynebacterium atrinae]WJY62726.1 ATP-dependent DNA helicase PcrA [Corynebacterium atrinae]